MKYEFDLVIIGAGSAGMVAGEVAPKMGVRTALVERARTLPFPVRRVACKSVKLTIGAERPGSLRAPGRYSLKGRAYLFISTGKDPIAGFHDHMLVGGRCNEARPENANTANRVAEAQIIQHGDGDPRRITETADDVGCSRRRSHLDRGKLSQREAALASPDPCNLVIENTVADATPLEQRLMLVARRHAGNVPPYPVPFPRHRKLNRWPVKVGTEAFRAKATATRADIKSVAEKLAGQPCSVCPLRRTVVHQGIDVAMSHRGDRRQHPARREATKGDADVTAERSGAWKSVRIGKAGAIGCATFPPVPSRADTLFR
ncbi:hypothetical protein LCGC14_0902880 [marine sediment metagenome]|uniref:Uncharacterized protein n=1 Tax=marine sediment metagenome TaxID=412755 RepID=A0A0F9S2S7_9ZZZZ